MEYKHYTSSVPNEQWLDFTSSDYLAFVCGPMPFIKNVQTPTQACRVEPVVPQVESHAPTVLTTQEEYNISPHLPLRGEIAPPSTLDFSISSAHPLRSIEPPFFYIFSMACSPPTTCRAAHHHHYLSIQIIIYYMLS